MQLNSGLKSSAVWAHLAAAVGAAALAAGAHGQCAAYTVTPFSGTIVPGTVDTTNHTDDGTNAVTLPFSWNFYGTAYTQAVVSSNGNMQFIASGGQTAYGNDCIPSTAFTVPTLAPHWDDQRTDVGTSGIFTSVSGSAPNRIFNVEWRTVYYDNNANTANYEIRLYEGLGRFDFVYGTMTEQGTSATIGAQSTSAGPSTQFSCNTTSLAGVQGLRFDCPAPNQPTCTLALTLSSGTVGGSFTATATVVPAGNPASTGIVVSLDASGVNGGSIVLHDDGVAPDAVAGDHVYSGTVAVGAATAAGAHLLTSTVVDDQARTSTCSATYTVLARPTSYEDLGAWTTPHSVTRSVTLAAGEVHWYRVVLPAVADPSAWLDAFTSSGGDTMIGVYDDSGTLKGFDDDDGVGTLSALSFGNASYPRNALGSDAAAFNGRDGALAAGTYWVALTDYPATFGASWGVVSTGGAGSPTIVFDLGSPINPAGSGAATPSSVNTCGGGTVLLTVATTPGVGPPPSTGITVSANLTSIGGAAAQAFYNDGTHGDVTGGDSTFTFSATIPQAVTSGIKTIPFTVLDAQGRSTSSSFSVIVNGCPLLGPDVIVNNLTDVQYFGNVGGATAAGIYAYAIGTNACNPGDQPVTWINGGNTHPVIAQNIYRLENGRFEQMGQSWLKHGFSSTNGSCPTCQQPPLGGQQLGVHCSDAYGAGLNGSQGNMGPRSQVNATTGVYPTSHSGPTDTSVIGGRLQIHWPDIDPAAHPTARYFAEGHYVTADDAQWVNTGAPYDIHGNGLNNATWKEINMTNPTLAGIPFIANDHSTQPAIMAWQTIDPTVAIANADYMDSNLTARFMVGGKVTANGNGTWTYEYAVYNHNADRSAGAFSVPLPPGAVVTNVGFHDVDSHSGEPYDLTDWVATVSAAGINWATVPYATNPNANALRWGTMYNFRFTVNAAPSSSGFATLGLFKPPTAGSPAASIAVGIPSPAMPTCSSADFNNDGDTGTDADIEAFFACLGGNCCPACWYKGADFNGDGDVGTDADIEAFFRVLGAGPAEDVRERLENPLLLSDLELL